ncbi:Thioredoxin F-type [Phytophthora citrophthora]|uniref:Thioredoxin F-type n=1 Tax=Phytophthora citrophthora TaxID=4793 RepID=A0AAD9LPI9_9STRA|nr:Thioredoxin F-type [Phytophthora citrophthora]
MIVISSAEDFHAAVAAATDKPLVACFSAPWCGGCKLVAPKVATLAEELAETVSFAKVSAEELETLCEEVEVDSFPHFRVYKADKILGDYTSSKFDKVDGFIRGLVAPDTVKKIEEAPEGQAVKETEQESPEGETATASAEQETVGGETTAETTEKNPEDVPARETTEEVPVDAEVEGSKKRLEREEMESNDEPAEKKAKTEEATQEDKKVEGVDTTVADVEKAEKATKQEMEKSVGEVTPAEKDEVNKAAEADVVPDATAA